MPGWVRPYLFGLLTTALVTGTVLLWTRPRHDAIDILIATPVAATITVSISGEVAPAGLYPLPTGSRAADLLAAAGGATERADPATPSRALLLRDEMHLHVPPAPVPAAPPAAQPREATTVAAAPTTGASTATTPMALAGTVAQPTATLTSAPPEATGAPLTVQPAPAATAPAPAPTTAAGPASPPTVAPTATPNPAVAPAPTGPINLNTASARELEVLPGIGPALAARIVADRERNGPFKRVEELDRVSGIGPATMARVRPLVTV